jgi:hypothetical protein
MPPPPWYSTSLVGLARQNIMFVETFLGVSVSVFGIAPVHSSLDGNFSCTFSLDGSPPIQYSTVNQTFWSRYLLHQEFFHADVSKGNHSLVINMTEVNLPKSGSPSFLLDYILFGRTTSTRIAKLPTPTVTNSPTPSYTYRATGSSSNNKSNIATPLIIVSIVAAVVSGMITAFARLNRKNRGRFAPPPPRPPPRRSTRHVSHHSEGKLG